MAIDKDLRATGIGASEISILAGMNPYRSRFDLYLAKTGQVDEIAPNTRQWLGKQLERAIAEIYTQVSGRAHQWDDTTHAGRRPMQVYTPDAFVGAEGGLDCKRVAFDQAYLWGDEGTQDIPDHIQLQGLWSIDASEREFWDVCALIGDEVRIYRILPDAEIQGELYELAVKFWRDHVVANVPPDMEYSSGAERWLKKKFPKSNGYMREIESPDEYAVVTAYAEAKGAADAADQQKKSWALKLKALIGEADGLSVGGKPVCTNRKSKDSTETDWQSVAIPLLRSLEPDIAQHLVSLHTKAVEGSRRLLLKKEKG